MTRYDLRAKGNSATELLIYGDIGSWDEAESNDARTVLCLILEEFRLLLLQECHRLRIGLHVQITNTWTLLLLILYSESCNTRRHLVHRDDTCGLIHTIDGLNEGRIFFGILWINTIVALSLVLAHVLRVIIIECL
jgi:hypothetical protein